MLETGEVVALKRINIKNATEGVPDNVLREVMAMQTVMHPNVVELQDVLPAVRAPPCSTYMQLGFARVASRLPASHSAMRPCSTTSRFTYQPSTSE